VKKRKLVLILTLPVAFILLSTCRPIHPATLPPTKVLTPTLEPRSTDTVVLTPTPLSPTNTPIPTARPQSFDEYRLELPPEGEIALYGKGGCKYYSRCPFAMDVCQTAPPALEELSEGHWVACYLRGSHAA
jgi:oligopeptide/dipeptide ABC transporter ATP-binding protein